MKPSAPDLEPWFRTQVLPHVPAVRRWLRRRFPSIGDSEDVVQEALVRVWRAHAASGVVSPKAFLFSTAHNVVRDGLRRRPSAVVGPLGEAERVDLVAEESDVGETVSRRQEFELLEQAIRTLPTRCREVFTLRKVRGLSQKEIAARLGIAEHTVEAQVGQGTRRCVAFFARHGLP